MNIRHNLIRVTTMAIAAGMTLAHSVTAETSIPEIGWTSRISSMGLDQIDNIGEQYTFHCQPAAEDLIHSPVWGTAQYTVNSGICSTAVHSGMIVPEEGGEVTLELIEGKSFYTGSRKNNVESKDHRNTEIAFVFIGERQVKPTKNAKAEETHQKPKREPSAIERMLMDGFQRGVERSIDRTIDNILN